MFFLLSSPVDVAMKPLKLDRLLLDQSQDCHLEEEFEICYMLSVNIICFFQKLQEDKTNIDS